jgi:hypothetical protein
MLCASALLSGCSTSEPVYKGPLFCDVAVAPYKWTRAEWDARVDEFDVNLRKELAHNEAHKEICGDDDQRIPSAS